MHFFILFFTMIISLDNALGSTQSRAFSFNESKGVVSKEDKEDTQDPDDVLLRLEYMLADDSEDKNKHRVNHTSSAEGATPLQSILINSPIRSTAANKREFLLMIQAWDYVAHQVDPEDAQPIISQLIDKYKKDLKNKEHYAHSLITFMYLRDRFARGNKKLDESQQTALIKSITSQVTIETASIRPFFETIEQKLSKIAEDQKATTVEVVEVVRDVGDPVSLLKSRYNSRDYRTTSRLVTFMFSEDNDVIGCTNPKMSDFLSNPFVIYRRPVPNLYIGIEDYYTKDNLRLTKKPAFLYQILLTDKENNNIVYGVPNPYTLTTVETSTEKADGSNRNKEFRDLVPLSRGNITPDMKQKAENVQRFLEGNNYIAYPFQFMGDSDRKSMQSYFLHQEEQKEIAQGQPTLVLKDTAIPMVDYLREQNFLTEAPPKYFVKVREVAFAADGALTDYGKGVDVPVAYFRDIASLDRYTNAALPDLFLIKTVENPTREKSLKEIEALKELYVSQVLYRFDQKTKTLVQESMGIPTPDILSKKASLEGVLAYEANAG